MNLRRLDYFLAVAEELHFGRAAERLGMAQPPLSRQIQQFEQELGAILFNRGRNAITLTQAGARLQERGRELMRGIEDMKLEIRRLGQGAEGRLRIGFVGSSSYGILPNIIKAFRAAYPGVNLSLMPMNNASLYRALIRREIDVAFARPTLSDPEFVTRKLCDEQLIVAVPDTLDTREGPVDLRDLGAENFILYPEFPRPSYADFVLEQCRSLGMEVPNRVFTMDLQTALSLVAIGEGVCVVPESVGSAPRNGIRFHRIEPPLGTTAVSINTRVDEQGVHVHKFATLAQEVARGLARKG
ncbi:LysR family transcriptional regulator [Amaricoccus solimangrovi]|uniref:LysR family transcriptional regulator n=1 Tax=Amaricoccus solimangrovi TaxID=2589815 RepID=A0A501WHD9_9RHOB|nr:LysR substrate-binding domain-containing protein [Amaricoccus solimangrovi]TPE48959.1 LysR family transcriptional regulator [Amaricoccus solimangrovi]